MSDLSEISLSFAYYKDVDFYYTQNLSPINFLKFLLVNLEIPISQLLHSKLFFDFDSFVKFVDLKDTIQDLLTFINENRFGICNELKNFYILNKNRERDFFSKSLEYFFNNRIEICENTIEIIFLRDEYYQKNISKFVTNIKILATQYLHLSKNFVHFENKQCKFETQVRKKLLTLNENQKLVYSYYWNFSNYNITLIGQALFYFENSIVVVKYGVKKDYTWFFESLIYSIIYQKPVYLVIGYKKVYKINYLDNDEFSKKLFITNFISYKQIKKFFKHNHFVYFKKLRSNRDLLNYLKNN